MSNKRNISYQEYASVVEMLAEHIVQGCKRYTNVYPIPRGGYFAAIQLSRILSLPIIFNEDEVSSSTLVVDDIVDSGRTLKGFSDNDTAVAYAKHRSEGIATYIGKVVNDSEYLLFPDEHETTVEDNIVRILEYIGENPNREGLIQTPDRIIRMWKEIFRGYDPAQKPKITTFENEEHIDDIVFDAGDYYSMCEHHMLPFFGKYYFAYMPSPNGRILGISKIARVVGYCAARLQLQERLAKDVIDMLSEALNGEAQGFAIAMRGKHLCKTMRGVKNDGKMTAVHLTGVFKTDEALRREFYKLIDLQKD